MIKTLGNYVLIKPDENKEKQTEGGIILPELRKEVPQSGIVVSLPVGEWQITSDPQPIIKEGTRVWFKMWAGQDITYEKQHYKSVHIKDIIAYEQGGEVK